jgi:hypothetical protein
MSEQIDAVVWGKDGIPASELVDPTTLISGVTHLTRQLIVSSPARLISDKNFVGISS